MTSQPRQATGARLGLSIRSAAFLGVLLSVLGWATVATADVYVAHPRLLFDSADIPALRMALTDGGTDDLAYAEIRTWAGTALGLPPALLLGNWEGMNTATPLGLAAWVEADGEPYAAKLRGMGLEIARHRPPSSDEFTTALRLTVMAFAYDMSFGGATPAERSEMRSAIRSFLDYMPPRFNFYCQAYNPYCGNHGMTVGAAMGLAAVVLWDDSTPAARDTLQARMNFADQLVDKVLSDILAPDGAFREGVLYAAWSMRVAIPYFEARRRFDGSEPGADLRLSRLVEWLCYELSPDGTGRTNNLNDSAWSTRPLALHNTLLPWAQSRWGSTLAKYLETHLTGVYGYDYATFADRVATALWSRPLAVADPGAVLPRGRLFGERGLYYYRSAWKTGAVGQEIVFSFFCGPFYGGHAQEDQNQITLAAHGTRWIVDCGPVSAAQTPRQTEA